MAQRKSDVGLQAASTEVASDVAAQEAQQQASLDSTSGNGKGEGAEKGKESRDARDRDGVSIDDLNLPKSIVTRLAKGVLPPNTQIQANATLALSKSATVFVNYLASEANERAQQANRKTISPADVLACLDDLQFPEFRPRLEAELQRYTELQSDKRQAQRRRAAAEKEGSRKTSEVGLGDGGLATPVAAPAVNRDANSTSMMSLDETEDEVSRPRAKKARRSTLGDTSMGGTDVDASMSMSMAQVDDEEEREREAREEREIEEAERQHEREVEEARRRGEDVGDEDATDREEEDDEEEEEGEEGDDDDRDEDMDEIDARRGRHAHGGIGSRDGSLGSARGRGRQSHGLGHGMDGEDEALDNGEDSD